MSKTAAAIEVRSLSKTYRDGWFRQPVQALKKVSFRVEPGQVFGLLGPNGAGKTTIVRLVLGIAHRTAGHASLLGFPAGSIAGRKRVGYLPENLRFPRHHTGLSALYYYGGLSNLSQSVLRSRCEKLLEQVGLLDRANSPIRKYSKGMRQRLGLAQALLHNPEILILDEPTDGMDPMGRAQVRKILQEMRAEGKTIFINSHLLQEIEMICDHVAILDKGELRYVGDIDKISQATTAIPVAEVIEDSDSESAGESDNALPATTAGHELKFSLLGQEKSIREAFAAWTVTDWQMTRENNYQVVVCVPDQTATDRCIDELRCGGISIVSFSHRKETLEDAFIGLIGKGGDNE